MSDEQNSGVGGTSRPTGKRQLSGAATTSTSSYEAKQVSSPKKSSDSSDSKPGGGVVSFLPEVVGEVRKVIWPTARQMVIYTLVVLGFLVILTALVSSVDFVAGLGVEKILSP
ncbi:preprotein translocase subunit SecE [Corynebacterium crudilactis]|uniref:Protein translocase subunit SecE n=1 Tax=Corynebacterium crudilactis TaxID=1652495 RepID=A0A172QR69_9CORY|nr:preprotein translocase subunit SecE [Corynebacterium crudilactis]ANE03186.1 preprotein translocase subunit SecE [Corynebacterium crudilactis]